jgi:fatty aldehyde-generating acyl-ACP reductase
MTDGLSNIRFALLGHPANYDHFVRLVQSSSESVSGRRLYSHQKTFAKFIDWMPSYVTNHRPVVALRHGTVEGRLIVCPFFPGQIKSPQQLKCAYNKVVAGCELAKQIGASVVSLGGFTSILEGANGNAVAERLGLTITSGNSLTAALAVAQLRAVLEAARRPIEQETVAVVGATGDIGRVCTLLLASSAKRLILIARNRTRLEAFATQIGTKIPVEIATDLRSVLSARVLITAAGATEPILTESELAPGTIGCDVGYPKNLSEGISRREDVLIFSGGLANLPEPVDLQSYSGLPAQNLLHGCFCEGIVLASRPENERHATAQGQADLKCANALFNAATKLGIEPAPAYRGNRLITREEIFYFGYRGVLRC